MDNERSRGVLVLSTLGLALLFSGTAAWLSNGWVSQTIATGVLNAIFIVYLVRSRDVLFGRLYLFGLLVGFGELVTDWWTIEKLDALDYDPRGPYVWASPLFMPFGWSVALVQIGYIGRWFHRKWGLPAAIVLTGLFGGMNIPLYETLAFYAEAWKYKNCWMLWDKTPWFIVLFEILICLPLPWIVRCIEERGGVRLVLLSVLESLWMWIAVVVSFWLVGSPRL